MRPKSILRRWPSGLLLLLFCVANPGLAQLTVDSPAWVIKGGVVGRPPFAGTVFLDPDIITPADPTTFESLSFAGQGNRLMFDRRVNQFINVFAYLFDLTFDDGMAAEIQVNPEFGSCAAALAAAETYAPAIGQLPAQLRSDVETVWIHKGVEPFGGGNNNLLIHTGQGDLYIADGFLEETFVHEACHTSLDAYHEAAPGWLTAQTMDGDFISTYAMDNPDREDVAESFLPYLAVRHRSSRITATLKQTIEQTIPNRIAYFDSQPFDLYPIDPAPTPCVAPSDLELMDDTILTTETFEACDTITVGPNFAILEPGKVTLKAGQQVIFGDDVSLDSLAELEVILVPSAGGPPTVIGCP